jgi:hypothetical protein
MNIRYFLKPNVKFFINMVIYQYKPLKTEEAYKPAITLAKMRHQFLIT